MARAKRKGARFRDKVSALIARGFPEESARAIAGSQTRKRKRKSKRARKAEARLRRRMQLMTVWGS